MDNLNFEQIKAFGVAHRTALIGASLLSSFVYLTKKLYFNGTAYTDNRVNKLTGKCVIVTGANTGIGKEAALEFAQRGARVILACRDVKKANAAAEEIRKASGNGNVVVELLDLSSFDSVRVFAAKINEKEERIDILVNNAGVMGLPKRLETKDGNELTFGTNHLGHFLLTNLLLEKIKHTSIQAEGARIVNVSSIANERGTMNWDDLNLKKENAYYDRTAYSQSKLANILFTRELAKRLEGTKVTSNSLHPGVVVTEIGRNFSKWRLLLITPLIPLFYWFAKNARQGAQTTIFCAVAPELNNVSGLYFKDCKAFQLLPKALDDADAARLWNISEDMCDLIKKP